MKITNLIKAFNKVIRPKKVKMLLLTLSLLVLLLLSTLIYLSYTQYRDTIVTQQQQHLLTIAKSIARSLELFVDEKADSLKIVVNNRKFQQQLQDYNNDTSKSLDTDILKSYYDSQKKGIENVRLTDRNGNLVLQYPITSEKITYQSDIAIVLKTHEPFVSDVYENQSKNFYIDVLEPVFYNGDFQGIILCTIRLDTMYKLLVEPVKAGDKGYGMVKNREGIILMHPVEEQIGAHVIDTRKEIYSDLDYRELEELIERQLTGEEGTATYHSYWWPDNNLQKVKKLTGFAPAYIGSDFWVIAVPMSYEEIAGPIKENLFSILLISSIFIIMLSGSIFIIIKMNESKEALEIETKYLKELNEKTEELMKSEASLRHSQKIQTIGTLTGGIAHEFNNLLTPILGYSEIILENLPKESDWYDDIHEIYDSSKKAKELLQQILIFSHRDKSKTTYEPICVKQKIKSSIKLVRLLLPTTITIIEKIDDCGSILVSPTQIHQILLNLCTNAYHAMEDEKGIIEIAAQVVNIEDEKVLQNNNRSSNKTYVKISVKDTGRGMDKETVQQVFDPFFTTKEVGKGTGLGLSVVHGIVSSHDGLITVDSTPGRGSTFTIFFPQVNDKQNAVLVDYKVLKGTEHIFIVDDDKSIIKMLKKSLERLGYHVRSETDTGKSIDYFKKHPTKYQMAIIDQTMPNMKGIELANILKSICPTLKVILITGFIDEKLQNDLNMGNINIDDYLLKPIMIDEISQKIRKVLDKKD